MRRRWLAALALVALPQAVGAETFILTTLEWCPYTCSALPGGGATTQVVRSALRAAGDDLEVEVLPWVRATQAAARDHRIAGYFPEYAADLNGFALSPVIGLGPLGIAEHKDRPLTFNTIGDLEPYRLGTVRGYLNTAAFDRSVAAGRQPVEENVSDEANLLKLALRRLDGVVIDGRVMAYLLAHQGELRSVGDVLRINPRLLEEKTLHVAAAPTEMGSRLLHSLRLGLSRIDAAVIQADYLRRNHIDMDGLIAALPPPPVSRPRPPSPP